MQQHNGSDCPEMPFFFSFCADLVSPLAHCSLKMGLVSEVYLMHRKVDMCFHFTKLGNILNNEHKPFSSSGLTVY